MDYVIERKDGHVTIMSTVTDDIDPQGEIAKWPEADQKNVVSISPLKSAPTDHAFFNSWMHLGGGVVGVNMVAAIAIHNKRVRYARAASLRELDAEYQRADESNDLQKKTSVAQRKQALRDFPQRQGIISAKTTDELRAEWISDLGDYIEGVPVDIK